jgi:peptidoglycan hydrolase-like protein with peptidoglycan-binding domain
MPGSPRDLAVVDHWSNSLERSRARRAHSEHGRTRGAHTGASLSALLDSRGPLHPVRDLADEEPWQLSLGRSRARRRAAQLRFVPTGSRAKRVSLGTLIALTVGPTASLASGQGTVTPTATPGPTTTTEHSIVLSSGSEGRQVQLLQQALGGIKVDGIFGPETEAAVRSFQASRGLSVDGVVGPLTSAALRSDSAGKAFGAQINTLVPGATPLASASEDSTTTPSKTTAGTTDTAGYTTTATTADQTGATGTQEASGTQEETQAGTGGTADASTEKNAVDSVKQLQIALHVNVDGNFGPETEAAVRALQARNGLPVNGVVDTQTWSTIGVHSAETLTPPPSAETAAAEETSAGAVKQLQIALDLPASGEFNAETETAVRTLQARHGLNVDGVVGPQTWSTIGVSDQETLTPPPSAVPQPAAQPAAQGAATTETGLTPGSGGAPDAAQTPPPTGATEVEWLQKALHVPVDGEFGPETEAAVRRLQARHGLAVDGVVGPATWALIGVQDESTLTPPASALVSQSDPSSPAGAQGAAGTAGAGEGEAASVVARVIAAADEIATRPYVYGGGHGSFESEGYDCSGSVSYALHGGGLISAPEDSGELESYGEPGPGRYITIYANAEHAYMVIDGRRFDTVALAETGSRWSDSPGDDGGDFVARHPDGL